MTGLTSPYHPYVKTEYPSRRNARELNLPWSHPLRAPDFGVKILDVGLLDEDSTIEIGDHDGAERPSLVFEPARRKRFRAAILNAWGGVGSEFCPTTPGVRFRGCCDLDGVVSNIASKLLLYFAVASLALTRVFLLRFDGLRLNGTWSGLGCTIFRDLCHEGDV